MLHNFGGSWGRRGPEVPEKSTWCRWTSLMLIEINDRKAHGEVSGRRSLFALLASTTVGLQQNISWWVWGNCWSIGPAFGKKSWTKTHQHFGNCPKLPPPTFKWLLLHFCLLKITFLSWAAWCCLWGCGAISLQGCCFMWGILWFGAGLDHWGRGGEAARCHLDFSWLLWSVCLCPPKLPMLRS